ncbi:VIT domain-containing protein [Roseimaritima ulvae]|nr:VIT domain-containing protein [Roseimaritima ulvae]
MLVKSLVGLSAIAALIAVLVTQNGDPPQGQPLGEVLDRALAAPTLKLDVQRPGQSAEVLIRQASLVRWQESDSQYTIATPEHRWQIDEQTNTVRRERSPWHRANSKQVDLLSLLDIDAKQAQQLRSSVAGESTTIEGRRRTLFTSTKGQPVAHGFFDATSGRLQELRCWPTGWSPQAVPRTLLIVARDLAVDESQFVVADKFSEDGRIGKIVDSAGVVTLRPMTQRRWTPVATQMLLKPGDWLRTDAWGANAATVALTSQFKIILGPASLLELRSPTDIRLHRGQVKLVGGSLAEESLTLHGPTEHTRTIRKQQTVHIRVDRHSQLVEPEAPPLWLSGYEGSSNVDEVGSLIANIDGRETPLTIGTHAVSVEIRDQIARTTIEETFVNHTGSRLEGVFYFPLPQDASISGFGMWIGGELIEADVVEKQRAREIYETILRERRDPGLLEWAGGNLFKARVFPIEALSEKRIKIVYTQVLPMRGNRYRYAYGLRSEMLQKTPLRQLSLDVQVHSALPLQSVECPTHAVRSQLTEHSAKLEFEAQQYTPTRDFEVVCQVASAGKDIVVVPHRRGEDGYFLAQLTPPGGDGDWQRQLVADGEPLDWLFVCDTSASMDQSMRSRQQQFVAAMLASLGPQDQFDIAYCDVECRWLNDELVPADEDNARRAYEWLNDRISLGWTDLERMVQAVQERVGENTQVIYIGDGIVTAGDATPQSFATRLPEISNAASIGTFHTVTVGSTFESTVLRALTSEGGGSIRHINGQQTPQRTAQELLTEITQGGLRDLDVQFEGLQVAAVYPQRLPNLAAGTQQIVLGRYLPSGEDQQGQIVITGTRDGKPVRYKADVALADAETGNSFIPRLWARAHLDHLLAQGSGPLVRDEIIALSERFHIITPYTSLLVLESDADRERFGVKRRYLMRDGERFFAEGRDNANFELLQQQMKRAGDWRLGLRRRILGDLVQLGRTPEWYRPLQRYGGFTPAYASSGPVSGFALGRSSGTMWMGGMGGMGDGWGGGGGMGGGMGGGFALGGRLRAEPFGMSVSGGADPFAMPMDFSGSLSLDDFDGLGAEDEARVDSLAESESIDWQMNQPMSEMMAQTPMGMRGLRSSRQQQGQRSRASSRSSLLAKKKLHFGGQAYYDSEQYVAWTQQLIPQVPARPQPARSGKPSGDPQSLEILNRLIQTIDRPLGEGLHVTRRTRRFDPVWDRVTAVDESVELSAVDRWLTFNNSVGSQTLAQWCDATQRGSFSRAFQIGATRPAFDLDVESFVPGQRPLATAEDYHAFEGHTATIESSADDRVIVRLTNDANEKQTHKITIDRSRQVVVAIEHWNPTDDGEPTLTRTIRYSQFKRVAGVWWPGKIVELSGDQQRVRETTQTVRLLNQQDFDQQFVAELPPPDASLLFSSRLPTTREAKIALKTSEADHDDLLQLILEAGREQAWDDALRRLSDLEQLVPEKPGVQWIRQAVLAAARRNAQALQTLHTLAADIAAGNRNDELFLCGYIVQQVTTLADSNEMLRILDQLTEVYSRQPEHAHAAWTLKDRRAYYLRNLQRPEAVELQRQLASETPWEASAHILYAQDLVRAGHHEQAYRWLAKQIDDLPDGADQVADALREHYAQMLRSEGRTADLVAYLEQWIAASPHSRGALLQYLTALMRDDRLDDVNEIAKRWMADAQQQQRLDPATLARLNAAADYALGQRYQLYVYWLDPAMAQPLAETARFFLQHPHHHAIASQIVGNSRFSNTDESDRLRREIASRLSEQVERLDASLVQAFVSWTAPFTEFPLHSKDEWKRIADMLKKRWDAEEDESQRKALASALHSLYSRQFPDTHLLPYMRARIERAEREQRLQDAAEHRWALFNILLERPWTAEQETEAADLIPQLGVSSTDVSPLPEQTRGLAEFVDTMLRQRQAASMAELQNSAEFDSLTRTELRAKRREFLRAAREGVVKVVVRSANATHDINDELAAWLQLERLTLDVQLGRKQKQAADQCWEMLGERPDQWLPEESELSRMSEPQKVQAISRALRQERALAVVSYLAARRSAPPALVQRVSEYIEVGAELDSADRFWWRERLYDWLIVLDQSETLRSKLTAWIETDPLPERWQRDLARLEAELGNIDTAIRLMESARQTTRLAPADYLTLADWYLVAERRQAYEQARLAVFDAMPEHEIYNWLQYKLQQWYRADDDLPTEVDDQTLFAFRALFANSRQPEHYVYLLKQVYTASRDFRLLAQLPDAVTGRTDQQIYPLLESLASQILNEIHKEATADEILRRIEVLRQQGTNARNQHALDLLETLVESRAAEVLDQPGPHDQNATAALQRAFKRDWAGGEIRQMAHFLASLGTLKTPGLRAERLKQLEELQQQTAAGSDDRFYVSWQMAHAVAWSNGEHEKASMMMDAALAEYRSAHPDGLPVSANDGVFDYARMLNYQGRFAAAEQLLTREIEHPLNVSQRQAYEVQRMLTYIHALRDDGQVSLGAGHELYENLQTHLLEHANAARDEAHRAAVMDALLRFYRTASDKRHPDVKEDLWTYASERFPSLLVRQTNNQQNLVSNVSQLISQRLDIRKNLEFLIGVFETYPQYLDYTYQSPWQQFGYQLSSQRKILQNDLSDLEPRLLQVVLNELRRDLQTQQNRSRYLYGNSGNFWNEKTDEFARVANEVYDQHPHAPRHVSYIARYLADSLGRPTRAIEMLMPLYENDRLSPRQQTDLVEYLQETDRREEAVAILEPLVEAYPDNVDHRTDLLTSYHKLERQQAFERLLHSTVSRFRKQGLWSESNVAAIAECCLKNEDYSSAAKYFSVAIAMNQAVVARQRYAQYTLSQYYGHLADAYSGLGDTRQAVDAASAAIVMWGDDVNQRRGMVYKLQQVLRAAKDLDDFVEHLDQQAADSGQDSPLIRKQIGFVYAERGKHDQAIVQLKLAIGMQPTDAETHTKLIELYDAHEDHAKAVEQTLALIDFDRHTLEHYQRLVQRLEDDTAMAERAITTIVEAAPLEGEHHQAIAEIRQRQNRWDEAIVHWKRVAELRRLEPTGLLKLAKAQIHQGHAAAARQTLTELSRTEWPARFSDVEQQVQRMREELKK